MMNNQNSASHRKHLLGFVIAPLVIGFLATYAESSGRFERLNGIAWDYFKVQSTPSAPDSRIRIIEIDDKTENALGWPLERESLARLIQAAKKYGAQAVGFDQLFTEDSEWGEDDDDAFRDALPPDGTVVLPSLIKAPLIPDLEATQRGKSHPLLDVGDDGVVRRVEFKLVSDDGAEKTKSWTALGVEVARAGGAGGNFSHERSGEMGYINFKNQEAWRHQSLLEVFNLIQSEDEALLREFFKDTFVLIGVTALGRHDTIYIPSLGQIAPVYGHANVLDNALNDDFLLHFSSRSKRAQRFFYIGLILFLSAAALYLRPPYALGIFALAFAGLWIAGYVLFAHQGVMIDVAGPSFVLALTLLFSGPNLTRELREALDVQERFAAELQVKVEERTAELEEQTRVAQSLRLDAQRYASELEVLDKQKTAFFQNMSHELRTPLTLILNPLEEAAQRYGDDEDLPVAVNNARRLLRLVNQLLDFQKLDAGRQSLTLRPLNLNQFLMICGDYFKSACSTKGINFDLVVDSQPRIILADPDALEKVIFNYLSNALKYTQSGGHISLGVKDLTDSASIKVFVTDSGQGIRKEDQSKLFEVFGQVEGSTTREYEGTGLGLALAKSLVQEMKGNVGVESEWGKGATFYATFSLSENQQADVQDVTFSNKAWLLADKGATGLESDIEDEEIEDALTPQDKATVLVVDDLKDMRELIAKTLVKQNYRVLKAANGAHGLEMIEQHRPDLVISDWMMPKLSGPEMLAQVRENDDISGTPCILLTAKSDDESKLIGTQIGADVFLGKPFNAQELVSAVRNLLALKAKEKEVLQLNHYITESVLKRYLPPTLITEIVEGRLTMDKPAELRTITVLFSDLVGFTKVSEKLGPEGIASFLNAYLTKMNEVIFEYGGTIDKFIGDAIMVMFGAPNDVEPKDQAKLAVQCASAMHIEMERLCKEWAERGAGDLKMRIGVHQGAAVVGNFGSDKRSDYTCIGPTVNLASRIESAAGPGETFASDLVRKQLAENWFQGAGQFELKGLDESQELYRLIV